MASSLWCAVSCVQTPSSTVQCHRHAVNDDLALTNRQVAPIEQARVEELEEQPPVAGDRREEHQGRRATHDGVDRLLHVGFQGLTRWSDAGAMVFIAHHAWHSTRACYKM